MKKPISHFLVNRKLFLVLLFLICSSIAKAQWTFTFQFTTSGPCPAGVPYPVIPPLPNLGLPTQASCESLRQIILSTRQIVPIYNGSKYVGDCVLYYTCTTCTGSDLVYPGQGSSSGQGIAGEVSINSLLEGKSLFSSHQSQAFEDWATEYKQLLASYGITSILDKNFIVPKTPLTEDKYFNAQYTTLSTSFKPKVAPTSNPIPQDADVVDLSNKTGVVQLLTNEKQQAERDEWSQARANNQGYTDMGTIPEDGIPRNTPEERSTADAAVRTAVGEAGELEGMYANWATKLTDKILGGSFKAVKEFVSGNDAKALEIGGNLEVNSLASTSKETGFDVASDKFVGFAFSKQLKSVPKAEMVHKIANVFVSFIGNKKPDQDE